MEAVLPPIRTPGSAQSYGKKGGVVPTPPRTGSGKSRPASDMTAKSLKMKNASRKEQEIILRRERLRAEQPLLSKAQTSSYRNTFVHNLCLDMLQAGFHRTFSELHQLMTQQATNREKAGPDSALWGEPLLSTENDKLESIKYYLTEAEEALRADDFPSVYKNRFELARYFQSRGDKWLSDHFFQTCLDVSSQEPNGEQRLCEALRFVGLSLEENGDLFDAVDKFEDYHKLSDGKSEWRTEAGKVYHNDACDLLTRIYTKISDNLDTEQKVAKVEYLLKAYNTAKEGGDERLAGEAAYKTGNAYIRMGDSKTALMYLKMYMEICETRQDDIGIGNACEAMAKAYDSEGKTEESLKYLVRFVEVAERSKQDMALATACSNLGYIYNSRGDYAEASRYFSKAFSLSQAKNNRAGTENSSVHFGISNALGMMNSVKHNLNQANKTNILNLISWKNQRVDQFPKAAPSQSESVQNGVQSEGVTLNSESVADD